MSYLTDPSRKDRVAKRITFRMVRLGDTTMVEQDDFLQYCKARGVRSFIVGLFNYKGDINSALPVPRYGCEHVNRLDILASGRVTLCCMDQDGQYGWGDANKMSVLDLYRHPEAKRYREHHASGRRREIEPCGTCNLFWPMLRDLTPIQAIRTGIDYCAYLAQHRPIGKKPPKVATSEDGLVQLRLNHQEAGQQAKATAKSRRRVDADAESEVPLA